MIDEKVDLLTDIIDTQIDLKAFSKRFQIWELKVDTEDIENEVNKEINQIDKQKELQQKTQEEAEQAVNEEIEKEYEKKYQRLNKISSIIFILASNSSSSILKIDFPANFSSSFIVSSIFSCFIPIFESTSCVSSFLVTASAPKHTTKNKIIDNILFFISLNSYFLFYNPSPIFIPVRLKKNESTTER